MGRDSADGRYIAYGLEAEAPKTLVNCGRGGGGFPVTVGETGEKVTVKKRKKLGNTTGEK